MLIVSCKLIIINSSLPVYYPGVEFSFSEGDFRAVEADLPSVPVTITKNQGATLANPVVFRVTPLTIQQAEDLRIIPSYTPPDDDNVSPSRASMNH